MSQVSKRKWALIVAFIVTVSLASSIAAYTGIKLINQPPSFDTDRDGLLNGSNETLPKDSGKAKEYINAGIQHRVNPDGSYTFFGEKTLGSDPSRPSPDAVNQAHFLSALSQGEYDAAEKAGILNNFNWDGDSWTNEFEHIIGSPYNVKNDIYAIILAPSAHDYEPVAETESFFKDKMKLPAENIHRLDGGNNTSANFEAAVNDIAKKADNNDIVYVDLRGDGNVDRFFFQGGSTDYRWIDETLDKINSKLMFVIADACHSGSSMDDLKDSGRIVLTSATDTQRIGLGIGWDFIKVFSNVSADKDGNNYVSIGEAAEFTKELHTRSDKTPQLSDPNNIGKSNYLIELKLEE